MCGPAWARSRKRLRPQLARSVQCSPRSRPLLELGEAPPVAEASRLGVTVLHTAGGDVSLGLFTLLKLDDAVQGPLKSELYTPAACAR